MQQEKEYQTVTCCSNILIPHLPIEGIIFCPKYYTDIKKLCNTISLDGYTMKDHKSKYHTSYISLILNESYKYIDRWRYVANTYGLMLERFPDREIYILYSDVYTTQEGEVYKYKEGAPIQLPDALRYMSDEQRERYQSIYSPVYNLIKFFNPVDYKDTVDYAAGYTAGE